MKWPQQTVLVNMGFWGIFKLTRPCTFLEVIRMHYKRTKAFFLGQKRYYKFVRHDKSNSEILELYR